ncbi:MAG: hypothetical protein PHU53_03980 [Thermoplasmata archaeon]|nr:hypothetical protein [Thermoplasmata archaeon]
MMKIGKIFLSIVSAIICLNIIACSNSGSSSPTFQVNALQPHYDLFNIFSDYKSMDEAFNGLNDTAFNSAMASILRDTPMDSLKDVLYLLDDLLANQNTYDTIAHLRDILYLTINQDDYDQNDTTAYHDGLFSYMDKLSASNAQIGDSVSPIIRKLIAYLNVTNATPEQKNAVMNELLYAIEEDQYDNNPDAQNLGTMIPKVMEAVGKLLLRNNMYMYLDSGGDLITDNALIDPASDTNTYLGNTVEGIDQLISSINTLATQDEAARTALYDVLREAGKVTYENANGKLLKDILLELMVNMSDYFIAGGSKFTSDYYKDDGTGAGIYVNAELRSTVRELWPVLQLLMIRSKATSDPADKVDYSIFKDDDGRSPLEVISMGLAKLKDAGIDLSTYTVEDSLKKMIQYNGYGQVRGAGETSYLDHLLFTLAVAYNLGYKTRLSDAGEPAENYERGHGIATNGIVTINDAMFNLTTNEILGLNAYELALDVRADLGGLVSRCSSYFTKAQRTSHPFYLGYDYPAFFMLPSSIAGDAGIPNGGDVAISGVPTNETGVDGTKDDYRTYFPKVANGIGEMNTAAVMMGMIARICWEGEGPYYSTYNSTTAGNVTTYYRPNGAIYARVTKPDANNADTWTFDYPVDSSCKMDVEDPLSSGQRENRYREIVYTDYFLAKVGFSDLYCPPPVNITNNGTNYVEGPTGGDKYKLKPDVNFNSDRAMFWEKIREKSAARECATQEEAIFRNLQWLFNEKKFVFCIPMGLEVMGFNTAVYLMVESNGLAGFGKARKGIDPSAPADASKGNGFWLKKGDEGTDLLTSAELTRRGMTVNYGDSYELGDMRVMLFCRNDGLDFITTVWENIIGYGHLLPDILSQNFDPVPLLGFMEYGATLASGSTDIGNASSAIWASRNKLVPVMIASLGMLHERSYYKKATSGNNYNYASTDHKYPLRTVIDGLIMPLVKPHMRRVMDSASPSTTGGGARWVPRINSSTDTGTIGTANIFLTPAAVDDTLDLRPRATLRTLTSLLTENQVGYRNGLIPLLAETSTISKVLALLQAVAANPTLADSRVKLFKGLEQVITAVKASKNTLITRQEAGNATPGDITDDNWTMMNYTNTEKWLFVKRAASYDPTEYVDLDVDNILDELVGMKDTINTAADGDFNVSNPATWNPELWTLTTPGKGLLGYFNRRTASTVANAFYTNHFPNAQWNWNNYEKLMAGMVNLLSNEGPNGTSYYIMDDVISLMDKFLSRVSGTDAELKGLRHTLGVFCTRYVDTNSDGVQDRWVTNPDLWHVIRVHLPFIVRNFNNHYDDLMLMAYSALQEGGIVPFLLHALKTHYGWEYVINDFYNFLADPFIVDWYAQPNLLHDLSDLVIQIADMLGQDWYTRMIFFGAGSYSSPLDNLVDGYTAEDMEFNPYRTMGKLFSR